MSASIVLANIQKDASPVFRKLANINITDLNQYNKAAEALSLLKELVKISEAKRKEIVDPLNKAVKSVNALFKPFTEKIEALEANVKQNMIAFHDKQEKKSIALEERFNEKGGKLSTLLEKQSDLQVVSKAASVRMLQTLNIIDESLIPRAYMMPDETKIMQALQDGIAVKGCEIIMKKSVAI